MPHYAPLYLEKKRENFGVIQDLKHRQNAHIIGSLKVNQEICSRSNEIGKLNNTLSKEKSLHENENERTNDLDAELKKTKEDLEHETNKITEVQQKNEILSKKIIDLEGNIEKSDNLNAVLHDKLRDKNTMIMEKVENLTAREREIEELRTRERQLKIELDEVNEEAKIRKERAHNKIKEAGKEIEKLIQETLNNKTKLESLNTELSQIEHELETSKEKANQEKSAIEELWLENAQGDDNLRVMHKEFLNYNKEVKNQIDKFHKCVVVLQKIINKYCCGDYETPNELRVPKEAIIFRLLQIKEAIISIVNKEIVFDTD